MNYKLNTLALQSGYRDQVALEKLIVDQIQYESKARLMGVEDLMQIDGKRDYLIPDVLPTPSVVLILLLVHLLLSEEKPFQSKKGLFFCLMEINP